MPLAVQGLDEASEQRFRAARTHLVRVGHASGVISAHAERNKVSAQVCPAESGGAQFALVHGRSKGWIKVEIAARALFHLYTHGEWCVRDLVLFLGQILLMVLDALTTPERVIVFDRDFVPGR